MRFLVWGLALLVALAIGVGFYLRNDMLRFEITRVTDDLHMLSTEWGGNVAILRTGEGAVVVDTLTFVMQGERIREIAEDLTGEEVALIINSHYHLDHSHGNPAFEPGTRVVATERTLHHLQQLDADHFEDEAAQLLPGELLRDSEDTLRIGDKTLRLVHPGPGHTDGDLVVLFEEDRTLHTGDLVFNRHYPNIDLEAGGSVRAWGDSLDVVLELPFDKVIPGHGELGDADSIRQFQGFVRQLWALGAYAASINGDLTDTLVNGELTLDAGYREISFGPLLQLDREFVIRRAWEEATGNFALYEGY